MNTHFRRRNTQMATKYFKKYSISLTIREMQNKTTVRYHLTHVQMSIITTSGSKFWWRCVERTCIHCRWECKLAQPLWKSVWSFFRKLKTEPPCDPDTWLISIYPKDSTSYHRNTYTPMFITVLLAIVRKSNQPRCQSTDEQIMKKWYKTVLYSTEKKKWNL